MHVRIVFDSIEEWASKWQLKFHPKKCKTMRIGDKYPKYNYTMTAEVGTILQLEETAGVDLGGIPLSRAPQISRRNTRFAGTVIRPGYQFLPRFGDLVLSLASLLLTNMLKQIKQIRITLMMMFKVYTSPPNEVGLPLICMQRRGTQGRVALFILRMASCFVLLLTSKLANCNKSHQSVSPQGSNYQGIMFEKPRRAKFR